MRAGIRSGRLAGRAAPGLGRLRPPTLHPVAWWLWAGALAAAAARTTNPAILGLVVAVAGYVVTARRGDAPWARSFGSLVRLALVVVVIRTLVQAGFGIRLPGHTLVTLPSLGLPSWAAGVSIGGPVTTESLAGALCEGLRLGAILACIGAANSLASPFRLLRCVPACLYEAAVAITVSISFTPEVVASVGRVREARRLRGRATSGVAGMRGIAVPVLEGALEHSVALAASMDSRGFGRRAISAGRQRLASGATLVGLGALAVGVYGILDTGAPAAIGLPAVGLGALGVTAGLAAGSRGARTRYRPDRWSAREWAVTASGVAALAAVIALGHVDPQVLRQQVNPLVAPSLPPVALLGIAVALLPAVVAPSQSRRAKPDPATEPAGIGAVA